MDKLPDTDYAFELVILFAQIICEDVTNRVRELHLSAFKELQGYLNFYKKRGYCSKLLCGIAEKKGDLILKIKTKTEMEKLMKPHAPHYDGAKFIPGEYYVPEEELICWSETSLVGPLNDEGHKRYMQVFSEIFPKESKELLQLA